MAPPRATGRKQPRRLSADDATTRYKRAAARAAAEMVREGMRLGLGTGSTVAQLLPALAARELHDLTCVATSPETERAARDVGLTVRSLDDVSELDMAIDGADQIDPQGWLVKGRGAAHTREKIVAAAARQFVVIASAEKAVPRLHPPVPLELIGFGARMTLARLGQAQLRNGVRASPDGGLIADYLGPIGEPGELAARLEATPGVVEHGLFAPGLVALMLIAGEAGVERRPGGARG